MTTTQTYTGSTAIVFPQSHVGNTTNFGKYNNAFIGPAGFTDTYVWKVLLAKVPHGATVHRVHVHGGWTGSLSANGTFSIGVFKGVDGADDDDAFVAASSLTAAFDWNLPGAGKLPIKISCSDDLQPHHAWISLVWNKTANTLSSSASVSVFAIVEYSMNAGELP